MNISGGTEIAAGFLGSPPYLPHKPCTLGLPLLGMAMDVYDPAGAAAARRGRRARLHAAVARHDARHLGRPRALPRHLLAALPRRLDARRLGLDRRRRRLVPARPLRRHPQRRRQAHRPGRVRVGPGRRPGRGRGLRGRRARTRSRARSSGASACCARAASPARSCAPPARRAAREELGKAFAPAEVRFTTALPKTRSAKILRRAVRATVLGEDPGDLSTLEDPGAIDAVRASSCSRACESSRDRGRRRVGGRGATPPRPRRRASSVVTPTIGVGTGQRLRADAHAISG